MCYNVIFVKILSLVGVRCFVTDLVIVLGFSSKLVVGTGSYDLYYIVSA